MKLVPDLHVEAYASGQWAIAWRNEVAHLLANYGLLCALRGSDFTCPVDVFPRDVLELAACMEIAA